MKILRKVEVVKLIKYAFLEAFRSRGDKNIRTWLIGLKCF
jgi:hypothetical protein